MKFSLRAFFVRTTIGIFFATAAIGSATAQSGSRYEALQSRAAELYSEQSYALAHQTWSEAAKLEVPEGERRTLDFYLADSLWRSRPDAAGVADARKQLGTLARGDDELSAEAAESLGDSWLAIENDWSRGWENYDRALRFWAAATDVDRARPRYLGIVWKATGPPEVNDWTRDVPLEVLANALSIAPNDEERARAQFFLGGWYARSGEAFSMRRALREFQSAVDAGPGTAVYEAALFRAAWLNLSAGEAEWRPDGQLVLRANYGRALELFRRFVSDFPKGKSALYERAREQIEEITRPQLDVNAIGQFLPGVKPVLRASWRNVGAVTFTLSRVDLARDFHPTAQTDPAKWLDALRVSTGTMVKQWKASDAPQQTYALRERTIELEPVTGPGTYLVEARSGGLSARTLVVVTEGAVIFNDVGTQAVAYFCDARTGAPAESVTARLWQVRSDDKQWRWTEAKPEAAKDGVIRFETPEAKNGWGGRAFLFGLAGAQPSLVLGEVSGGGDALDEWRIQVLTDRAAYRPRETVSWKLIARRGKDGTYATPAGELVNFKILDPNGDAVSTGAVKLTEFGGAWGELAVKPEFKLGEYSIEFSRGDDQIGAATLFRLEEYRLPEFKVNVAIAPEGDKGVRLGDEVEARISGEYYFGGAVADAKISVQIREEAYHRPSPWETRAEEMASRGRPDMSSRVIKTEMVRTSPDGMAIVRFQTPLDAPDDRRYVIEARVVDSSGREVVGNGGVVVGRQSYFAELKSSRRVAAPGDKVPIVIETKDGNERRIATKGVLSITRQRWSEVWLDPQGREVSGDALDKLKRGIFPPDGEFGWRLVRQEYVSEEGEKIDVATDASGWATYQFVPKKEGFYRIAWSSPDAGAAPVTAETDVWVSTTAGSLIGYRSGGVEVIVDPTAPSRDGKVPVLITADTSNRDVLFLVHAGGNLFRAEVVHLDGDSKLVELDADERFVPNVFVSVAAMRGLEYFSDTRPVAFPPYRKTLSVDLRPHAEEVAPGAESGFDLTVKDAEGRPVRGEFALGVADEAISSIQGDYATDPVKFFWGGERSNDLRIESSVSSSPFLTRKTACRDGASDQSAGAFGGAAVRRGRAMGEASKVPAALPAEQAFSETMAVVAEEPAVTVRTNFSATAFWSPSVLTDANGVASVRFKYPDSLTTWKTVVRGATTGSEFGQAEAATRTTLPLIARLQAPRFLVSGDKVDISSVVNNRTAQSMTARVDLRSEGLSGSPKPQTLRIDANGDARTAWTLEAGQPGTAKLTLTAAAGKASDGMTTEVPIAPNGIEKSVLVSGKAVDSETTWKLSIPAERRPGSESLVVTATPSLAATALDALPYLVSYPYGCVEQTMSRFLPAAVTARTLQSLGLDRGAVAARIYGGIEPQFLAKTHPKMDGAAGMEELDAAIATGLARLVDFQHGDGAWGWWKGDESDPFMTAYVVWGLRLAQQAGVPVRSDLIKSGSDWLRKHLVDAAGDPNLQAWLLHALAVQQDSAGKISKEERAAFDNLWTKRDQLTAYGRALFALAAHDYGETTKAQTLARNLYDGVQRDAQPGVSAVTGAGQANATAVPTAHWGSEGMFRAWQDGGVEATAFALQALLAIDPKSDLVEPAMNWLVKNRRGAQWSNTRDTAITVLAMNRYLAATKELGKPASFEIDVNGKKAGEVKAVAAALDGPTKFTVDRALLRDGENVITLRGAEGNPPIYVSAQAKFFTFEEPIPAAGNEIFVKRDYALFSPRATLLDGYRFDRIPWKVGEPAAPDQRVEETLTIDAKNNLEYVLVEDLKPAGLEAVNVRSGEAMDAIGPNGQTVPVYCELRDRKVALFMRKLPPGTWTIRYELRTETPGNFSALPVVGEAMYAPEIRANGESRRVEIR